MVRRTWEEFPDGAKELQRAYVKQMSLAFIFAVALTLAFVSMLRYVIDPAAFNPPPPHVIRIFNCSEIELPRALNPVDVGMSAYPVLQDQSEPSDAASMDASFPATTLRNGSTSRKRNAPVLNDHSRKILCSAGTGRCR